MKMKRMERWNKKKKREREKEKEKKRNNRKQNGSILQFKVYVNGLTLQNKSKVSSHSLNTLIENESNRRRKKDINGSNHRTLIS